MTALTAPDPEDLTPNDLVQIEAIRQLKYRYLRAIDQKLWDLLAETLSEDCVASYGGGAYCFDGREQIVGFLRGTMAADTFHSSHRCHHPEIRLLDATTAVGTWALDDVVILTDVELTVRGAAFYDDGYQKLGGRWHIARTAYKRIYEEIQPRGDVAGLELTASWWLTGGRSSLPAG